MLKEKLINLNIIFLGFALLFALLIYKDPFSQRNLIPNFEPYPDTIYYINPALSFVKGEGFHVRREGRLVNFSVPPLYSFSLIPSFVLKQDPRMSYYTNVVLGFISLFLFWLILRILFKNKLITYFLLILYMTNYYIYWVPSIIMAENLTLTLFLAAVFFLLSKSTLINSIFISALVVGIYATKYANVPLSGVIFVMYPIKIFLEGLAFKQKKGLMISFLISLTGFYLLLSGFETITKGKDFLSQLLVVLSSIYGSLPKSSTNLQTVAVSHTWFGIEYISKNFPFYIKTLFGAPNKFLWDSTPLVPGFIGIFGSLGIIWNIFNKKFSFLSVTLITFILSLVAFMSTFYTYDARYIYIAIPTLLIGFGLFLQSTEKIIGANKKKIIKILLFIFIAIYLIGSFIRVKSQISLNLKYAETPWYYIAVLKMNEVFTTEKIENGKKPILISALPPYFIDYYSNGNYILLPLSYEQEFRGQEVRQIVWGPNDYSDLPKLYTKYLKEGFNLYVSRSGLGNEGYTNRDFNTIVKEFNTELVLQGCYDQCNIYRVKLKE